MKKFKILVINPGSTSTKIAIFENDDVLFEKNLTHSAADLAGFERIIEQLPYRQDAVLRFIETSPVQLSDLDCIVARGGMLRPIPGGTYRVDEAVCHDLIYAKKEHASNLAALIARDLAKTAGIEAYIVDPVVVDELDELARITGLAGVQRRSIFHALNQKACARKAAAKLDKPLDECNLIIAHLGGGISVGAHCRGRVIDVNNALDGDGPFSPERAGGLPVADVVDLCLHGGLNEPAIKKLLVGKGGLVSHLGTSDGRDVELMISGGNAAAGKIYEAMAYQTAKEIGACAAVLQGQIDAIVLTGGLAYSDMLVAWISERVSFISQILIFPGEGEMESLAGGGLRVLRSEEPFKVYSEELLTK